MNGKCSQWARMFACLLVMFAGGGTASAQTTDMGATPTLKPGTLDKTSEIGASPAPAPASAPGAAKTGKEAKPAKAPKPTGAGAGKPEASPAPASKAAMPAGDGAGGTKSVRPAAAGPTTGARPVGPGEPAASAKTASPVEGARPKAKSAASANAAPAGTPPDKGASEGEGETARGTLAAPAASSPKAAAPAASSPKAAAPAASSPKAAVSPGDAGSGGAPAPAAPPPPKALTIASWGGAYKESQVLAYFKPFQADSDIKLTIVTHGGGKAIAGAASADALGWDVADLPLSVAERACERGLLQPLEASILKAGPAGEPAREDFVAGSLSRCAIASMAWSLVIVSDRSAFPGEKPKTLADFFDLDAFPGKRGLPKGARYVLELALMADGVAPKDVYDTLATPDGLGRALTKLQSIKDHIIWWETPRQAMKMLADGRAAMVTSYSGRVFAETQTRRRPYDVIWDGQIYDLDAWVVSRSARNKKAALDFIAFATRPERMAAQARWFPYGPTRRSAIAKVGRHPVLSIKMAPHLPTAPDNFAHALKFRPSWWREREDLMKEKVEAWVGFSQGEGSAKDGVPIPGLKPDEL